MLKVPLAVPVLGGSEELMVLQAIANNQIAVGPHIELLESHLANYISTKYAIAVNSGTAALQLMLEASNMKKGMVVLTPAITFAATVNAIIKAGFQPGFIDVNLRDLCVDESKLRTFLSEECYQDSDIVIHKETQHVIGGIMVVHMYGNVCDMQAIKKIAKEFELEVFEDGTEALGAKQGDNRVGHDSRFFALSFNGNKIITSGGGGMLLTNELHVAELVRMLASQGKSFMNPNDIKLVGHNFRMPNLNAAFACGQFVMLDEFIASKQRIAKYYKKILGKVPGLSILSSRPGTTGSSWMSILRINSKICNLRSFDLGKKLQESGIQTRPIWKPLNAMEPYKKYLTSNLECSYRAYESDLCLPCSVDLHEDVINLVCEEIIKHISIK